MVKISIDAGALVATLSGLPDKIGAANEVGLDKIAGVAIKAKDREIAKTYGRSIPRGKNGQTKWMRTGDWRDNQIIESSNGERAVVTTGEAANYEARLAELPVGRDGVNRRNPAAQNAQRETEKRAIKLVEDEIKKALRL